MTGDIKTDIIDKHNHFLDSVRYSIEKIMKRKSAVGVLLPRRR